MKKKFTLFALALLSVVAFAYQTTRASGDPTVLYSWESPDGTIVETGGTATYENGDGDRLNYKQTFKISEEVTVNYYTMCLNGKKANINDATASANAGHMLITLNEELQEGDEIAITAFLNKNESKKSSAWVVFEKGDAIDSGDFSDESNLGMDNTLSPTTKTITVAAGNAGSKTIKLTRGTTGTNLFITKLVISRAETAHEHTPASAVRENENPATCTVDGSYDEVVYCSVCGEELSRETKTIPALGHMYDGEGICERCGYNSASGESSTDESVTVDFTDNGYENGEKMTSPVTENGVMVEFGNGTNTSNGPAWYNTGNAVRFYAGNTMTVSAEKKIKKIVITFGTGDGSNDITTDVETYTDGTWEGESNSVTFTIDGTKGHRRIAKLDVTLDEESSETPTELEVPGTVIWSSDDPVAVNWSGDVMISGESLEGVKVGDILHIGILGAPEGANPDNWAYQVDPRNGWYQTVDHGEPLMQPGDYVHDFVITGDMLKSYKERGLLIFGTGYSVKKVTVESKYSGSDESIWLGDVTLGGWPPINVYPDHFKMANNEEGVKEGQIIRVNCTPAAGLAMKYQGESTGWSITEFTDLDLSSCVTETGYDIPVTEDMVSILKDNRLLLTGDGTVKVTSVELVDAPAVEPEVVEIIVEPADGTDIYEAYAAKVKEVTDAGNVVGKITIRLADNASYTISKTIIANKDISIVGDNTTIDASGLEGNMIEMATLDNPTEWTEVKLELLDITVKGLKKSLFFSNSKNYAFTRFNIYDCLIEQAGDATTIDFTKGSTALYLECSSSTFYAPTATTKAFYSSQGGQKATEYKSDATQTFWLEYNTMYNLASGKNFFSHRQSNQTWLKYNLSHNIFVNCGKSGQVVRGMNGGQSGKNPSWFINQNLFNFDGADTGAAESTGDEAEPVMDSVEGIIVFTDPTAPDFSGTVLQSSPATVPTLGDPRWTLTYGKALAINITESEGGKVTASPSAAAEGMTVTLTATPAEGYELESLTVKDGADADVTVNEDNTFTMPATDVTVTATFKKLPVDVNITVESDNDIAAAVETAADGAPIKSISVTLEEGGTYTISKSLSAQGNVIINGNGATIDASALTTPFVQMADLPTEGLNDKGAYEIDEVSFNDVTITGLPYQLFYANKQKYLITTLKVDNSVIGINGSKNKTIFDFNGGGNCLNLTVNNSTLWANPSNAQNGGFYSSQSGQSVQDLKDGAEQVTTISNSTIYNIASGKTTSTRRKNSQDWIKYVVKNSIIAESGKSGQFLKGLNAGQPGKDAEWTVDGNTFIFGGAVIEEQTVGSTAENIQNSLTSDPEFADAANGDFTVGESTEQAELETGDPRWLVEFVGGEGDATDLLAEIEEAKKLLKYSMPYYDENNEESPETEGKALVDAIRDAEEKAEGGTSQKKLDKMLEELKQAEIDYTTALMDYELAESEAILAGADPADELAAEIQRLYDTQDVVREDYSNQPKHIKNYADEIDKAQKAYLRNAINELIPEAQAMADSPEVKNALDKANEALEGDSSEDLFDALNGLLEAMETATGIRGIEANDTDDAPVYNMGGQRVSSHAKGIVIKNGKKIIRK